MAEKRKRKMMTVIHPDSGDVLEFPEKAEGFAEQLREGVLPKVVRAKLGEERKAAAERRKRRGY